MSDMVRLVVRFDGNVQGVGLTHTISKYCMWHDVTGWVQNGDDPTLVLAVLQGERETIEQVLLLVEAYFSIPGRCRGMSVDVISELPLVWGETQMCVADCGEA